MLHFQFTDKNHESAYVPLLEQTYTDTAALLSGLSDDMIIKFTTADMASDQTGVGGFAESPRQLNVAIAKGFSDLVTQQRNLRAVVFHELFHINQGFTFEQSPFTAIEAAIYEGCAVRFEREYGGGEAVYADYTGNTDEQLSDWQRQLDAVGTKYFEDNETWHKWAFYNPELDQKWIIYKVGSWLVEKLLVEHKLNVLDLQDRTAKDILGLISSH